MAAWARHPANSACYGSRVLATLVAQFGPSVRCLRDSAWLLASNVGSAVFCRLAGTRRPGFAIPGGLLSGWRSLCPVGLLRRLCPVLVGRLLFAPLRFSDALIRMLHKYCLCTAHLDLKAPRTNTRHTGWWRARKAGKNRSCCTRDNTQSTQADPSPFGAGNRALRPSGYGDG